MAPQVQRRARLRAERGANRAAIVAAAEAALRERPFREVSVEELMERAGLARTQFYRHFDDLSDLVLTVTGDAFAELLTAQEQLVEVAGMTAANLRAAIAPAVHAFAEHGPLVRAVSEAAVHDSAVEEVFTAVQERYVALVERLVRRAAAAGAPIADPAQTARLLHLGNVAYFIDVFGHGQAVSAEVALDTVLASWCAVLGVRDPT
jgi:AcrR family transcriptional regulator